MERARQTITTYPDRFEMNESGARVNGFLFWMRKLDPGPRFVAPAVLFSAHFLIFYLLGPAGGTGLAALAAIPVVLAAWLFGLQGGLIFSALSAVANTLLISHSLNIPIAAAAVRPGNLAGMFVLISLAIAIHGVRNLTDRVRGDLQRRQQAEAVLRESEARYRTLFEHAPVGLAVIGHDGKIVAFNDEILKPGGYLREDVANLENITDLFFDKGEKRAVIHALRVEGQVSSVEVGMKRKDGEMTRIRLSVVPSSLWGQSSHLVMALDVNEERQAIDRLSAKERRFRALVEKSRDAVALLGLDGTILEESVAVTRVLGYSPEELVGESVFSLIHLEDLEGAQEKFFELLREPGASIGVTIRCIHKNGEWIWIEATGTNLLEDPDVGAIILNYRDVTTDVRRKRDLAESERFLSVLSEITNAALAAVDLNPVLQTLVDTMAGLFSADACYMTLWDPETRRPIPMAAYGQMRETYAQIVVPAHQNTLTESLLRSGGPLAVENVQDSPHIDPGIATIFPNKACLGLPLIAGANKIGAILIAFDEERSFSDAEIERGAQAAAQLALAIHKFQLLEETRTRADIFSSLFEVSRSLTGQQELNTLLKSIALNAKTLISADAAGIYLYSKETDDLVVEVSTSKLLPVGARLKIGEGMAGKVFTAREPMIVEDYMVWEGRSEAYEGVPIRAAVQVPLNYAGEIFGVLLAHLVGENQRRFTEMDVNLLSLFASQAAGAVRNARLFEQTRRRLVEHEAVRRMSEGLREVEALGPTTSRLVEELLNAFEVEDASLWLFNPEDGMLHEQVAYGWFRDLPRIPLEPGKGITGTVFLEGAAYATREFVSDPLTPIPQGVQLPGGYGGAAVPINAANSVIGVLLIAVQLPREFDPQEINLIATMAEIGGIAIQRARLHDQTNRRLNQLQSLRLIDTNITSSFDLNIILEVILDQARLHLETDAAQILVYDNNLQFLERAAVQGLPWDGGKLGSLRLGQDLTGAACLEKRTLKLRDIRTIQPGDRLASFAAMGLVGYMAVPLVAKGLLKGVLEVFLRRELTAGNEWMDFLTSISAQAAIAIENAHMFDGLERSNLDLYLAYDRTLEGWARALDLRDSATEGHTKRVTDMTMKLAHTLGMRGDDMVHIRRGALLHDIGKMGIPDRILLKNGPLNEEEWEIMRRHPEYAYQFLWPVEFLRPALDIPYCHHEWWDGSGYPRKLKGEEIPMAARIFAIIDSWDALLSDRPYRRAWKKGDVIRHIESEAGTHFDPRIVDVFLRWVAEEELEP